MAQGSSLAGPVAAALILGGSLLGGSYLIAGSIDRGATELANLKTAVQTAAAAQPAARPAAAPSRSRRPDPSKVYDVKVGSAPTKGNANAAITVVEFSDFQ
jgi:protein-disulfide isomerase